MGNLLGAPITDKETHSGQMEDGTPFAVSSMQGWRVHMEDAHICEPNIYAVDSKAEPIRKIPLPGHAVYAVFDGHGGSFAALYSGKQFCNVLARQPNFFAYATYMEERPEKEKSLSPAEWAAFVREGQEMLEGALQDAFVELDREILEQIHKANVARATGTVTDDSKEDEDTVMPCEEEDAGTTAVVVVLTPQVIVCANAGDSRAVYSKMGHQAVPLSYDHKPDDEDEERRIRAAGGYVAGGRVEGDLAVSRGLGDFRFKELDSVMCKPKAMGPGDQKVSPVPDIIIQSRNAAQDEFIVVACDGIWDVLTNQDCVSCVAEMFDEGEAKVELMCEELLDICLSKGSKDNMTALIVKFEAQKVGIGGGIAKRREGREESQMKEGQSDDEKEADADQRESTGIALN